ncbi:hypothetical protein H6X68_09240 [Actinomyces sp. 186855]|nr:MULTISPECIES: hypothetical protein [unclassified Actinomyces]MCL3776964.1 hypothetical protein [Actinomyces sp. AC-20-1]MCL3790232.1 hypothetical protein [Actinomyces sp. 187325]MCL3792756.1 hypothetical protein [Actinomyces sp. 186855]MCL3795234.1 hypothetical protein [Actinomyces sp. 217892]
MPPPPRTAPHRPLVRLPRPLQVLLVWAACTALTLLLARLGAQDTPATPWAGPRPSWGEHTSFWDAGWYARIESEGYPAELPLDASGRVTQSTWAFMPLLATLAGLLSWTGASFYTRAALVSLTSSALAAVLADRWLSPRTGASTSLWAVALVWSGPCALVLQGAYAEPLALALVASVLLLADRRRFLAAVPLVPLAALSRPVGLPLAAGLGLWWLADLLRSRGAPPAVVRGPLAAALGAGLSAAQRARLLVLTAVALASALLWPALAWAVTGRADAYTATETAWRGSHLLPFTPWVLRSGWWAGEHLGPVLLAGVLVLVGAVLGSRALRSTGAAAWTWCAGYVLYLLVFFDPTTSLLRLLLPLLPVGWALADALGRHHGRRGLALALVCCVLGQVLWISWVWDLASVSVQWVP